MFLLSAHTTNVSPMVLWIGIVLVLFLGALFFFKKTTRGRGVYGELRVRRKLNRIFRKDAIIFNNYLYADGARKGGRSAKNGKSVQIDHIVVCRKGVLVIETKNYSGRLYGTLSQREWTQVLAGGKVKNKLYNPIKQNEAHCFCVRKAVGAGAPVHPFVVLVQNNTEHLSCGEQVIGMSDMKRTFAKLPNVLSKAQVKKISEQLAAADSSGIFAAWRHRKNVKRKSKKLRKS